MEIPISARLPTPNDHNATVNASVKNPYYHVKIYTLYVALEVTLLMGNRLNKENEEIINDGVKHSRRKLFSTGWWGLNVVSQYYRVLRCNLV